MARRLLLRSAHQRQLLAYSEAYDRDKDRNPDHSGASTYKVRPLLLIGLLW